MVIKRPCNWFHTYMLSTQEKQTCQISSTLCSQCTHSFLGVSDRLVYSGLNYIFGSENILRKSSSKSLNLLEYRTINLINSYNIYSIIKKNSYNILNYKL